MYIIVYHVLLMDTKLDYNSCVGNHLNRDVYFLFSVNEVT